MLRNKQQVFFIKNVLEWVCQPSQPKNLICAKTINISEKNNMNKKEFVFTDNQVSDISEGIDK